MGWGGCADATQVITTTLASPDGARRARQLVVAGASPEQFFAGMVELAPEGTRALLVEEMRELPSITASSVMYGWALADAVGKPFVMRSVIPDEPMAFARRRQVRLALDVDEAGVTLSLSHIPTRHAAWYGVPQVTGV